MSDSNKFTPGPWVVTEDIRTEEEVEYIAGFNIEDEFGDEIVGSEGIYGDFGENRNNANLIAAAPDLLEALEGMIGLFPTGVEDDGAGIGFNETLKQKYRNAVIASKKARGQQ